MLKIYAMRILSLLSVISIVFITNSCDIINPEESIPAYISINNITIQEETNTLSITDAWIYIDGSLIGVYNLPATLPILYEGNHKISVRAGIKVDGIAKIRSFYPFYNPYIIEQDIVPGEIITLSPIVTYTEDRYLDWAEDFEGIGISIDTALGSETIMSFTNNNPFQGSYSGKIFLEKNQSVFHGIIINSFYELPLNKTPVFMELNYKNDIEFFFGMYILNSDGSIDDKHILLVNTKETWNKIYIDLANPISNYQEGINFKFYFTVYKTDTTKTAEVLLDNIKIVYAKNE